MMTDEGGPPVLVADRDGDWYLGTITVTLGEYKEEHLGIHYIGWDDSFDEIVPLLGGRIVPVFSTMKGHHHFLRNLKIGDPVDVRWVDRGWVTARVCNVLSSTEITVGHTFFGGYYSELTFKEDEWMRRLLPPTTATQLKRLNHNTNDTSVEEQGHEDHDDDVEDNDEEEGDDVVENDDEEEENAHQNDHTIVVGSTVLPPIFDFLLDDLPQQ